MPMLPPAPARFSTTTGCPRSSPSGAATARDSVSTTAPGGNGLMRRTGLDGYDCAKAPAAKQARSARTARVISRALQPFRLGPQPLGADLLVPCFELRAVS